MPTADQIAKAIEYAKQIQELLSATATPTPTPEPTGLVTLEGYDTLPVVNYTKDGFVRGINTTTLEIALPAKYNLRNYLDVIQTTKRGLNVGKVPYRLDGNVQLVSIGVVLDPVAEGYPQSVIVKNKGVTVSGPTPVSPGGEPTPIPTPTPTPVPKYAYIPMGVNGHEGIESAYPAAQMEARIKLLAEANLKSYRVDMRIIDNTAEVNRLIDLCEKYGVTLRPMLYPTTEAKAYEYAKRFGARVKVWEIGNEQNLAGKTGAESRIDAMVATYKGMKRASDELGLGLKFTINVTSCNSNDANGRCYGDKTGDTWFLEMARARGFLFDHISFHHYPYLGDKGTWMDLYLGQMKGFALKYNTKIFYNETNAAEIYKGGTGVEQASIDSVRQIIEILNSGYRDIVQEINFYEFMDEPAHSVEHERHFGLMFDINKPKPVWDLVKQYALATAPVASPVPTPAPTPTTFKRRAVGNVALNVGLGAGGDSAIPGIEQTNYTMTKDSELDRALAMGIKKVRIGFLEGRIFKTAGKTDYWQGNDVTQPTWGRVMTLDHLWRIGASCASRGMEAMLDDHNYGFFPSNGASPKYLLGSPQNTIEMWVERKYKLLELLKSKPEAWKGIKRIDVINEPYMAEHTAAFLAKAYMALLDRCVPLTGKDVVYSLNSQFYSSMSNWANYAGNAYDALIEKYRDVIEFSAHGYLDKNRSGYFDLNKNGVYEASEEVLGNGETWETLHLSRAQNFVEWLKQKNVNGSVGETVAPGNFSKFMAAQRNLMTYLLDNGVDVYTFALGDGLSKKSEHNIETTAAQSGGSGLDMTAMLNLVKELAAKYNK